MSKRFLDLVSVGMPGNNTSPGSLRQAINYFDQLVIFLIQLILLQHARLFPGARSSCYRV